MTKRSALAAAIPAAGLLGFGGFAWVHAQAGGASAWNYFMILDVSVTPPAVAGTGRNHDTFVRTRDGWRFNSRTTYDINGRQLQLAIDEAD